MPQFNFDNIPLAQLHEWLQPYINAAPAKAVTRNKNNTSNLHGTPPAVLANYRSTTTADAQANIPGQRKHLFARIAERCGQVKQSLETHGLGDSRPLWYLGFLTLAHFCTDGADFIHEIGNGD